MCCACHATGPLNNGWALVGVSCQLIGRTFISPWGFTSPFRVESTVHGSLVDWVPAVHKPIIPISYPYSLRWLRSIEVSRLCIIFIIPIPKIVARRQWGERKRNLKVHYSFTLCGPAYLALEHFWK